MFRHLIVLLFLLQTSAPVLSQSISTDLYRPNTADLPSIDAFVRIIEDDESRAVLLARIKAAGAAQNVAREPGLAARLAEYSRDLAQRLANAGQLAVATLRDIGTNLQQASIASLAAGSTTLLYLCVVAGTIALVSTALRLITRILKNGWMKRSNPRHRIVVFVLIIAFTLSDIAAVAIAWCAGYLVALHPLIGLTGQIGISQTLLLNSFLVVEMAKALLRGILLPGDVRLQILPISPTAAAYWYFWNARVISLLGYAFLFAAPITETAFSQAAASAIRISAGVVTAVIAIVIVLQNRERVRRVLRHSRRARPHGTLSRALSWLGAYWHVLAIAYIVVFLLLSLLNPSDALPFIVSATIETVIAIAAGLLVISLMARFLDVGIPIPDDLKEKLPLLQPRLQAFVPRVMQVLRLIATIGILISVGQSWGLIDFLGWVSTKSGQILIASIVSALLILLAGFAIYLAMSCWVEYRLNPNYGTVATAREKTLLSLFRNAFTIALFVVVGMLALAQIGVNIAPLLAGAGVLGLAIGFGAQKFVQDIITGAFIQFENIMNEGDVVSAGGQSGVVEKLTIRSVSIRSLDGTLHLIPFSSVDSVSNMMKGFSFHVAEIGVAYRENIDEVKSAMYEAFDLLLETEHKDDIIGELEMQGITAFADSAITVRARIKTLPGKHWGVGRSYNGFIKDVFDRCNIEIPFPHVTVYMGEDKSGKAPRSMCGLIRRKGNTMGTAEPWRRSRSTAAPVRT